MICNPVHLDPENRDEAAKFRNFWGKKAELRRFKDGTIAESTVWDCESWEKHASMKRIAAYVRTKHLSLQKEDLIHVVDQLDFCLLVGGQDPVSSSGTLFEAFDTLAKQLRLLDDVPHKISTVQPLDSAFRHTSVFPPEPHPLAYENNSSHRLPNFTATCLRSLEVMIQECFREKDFLNHRYHAKRCLYLCVVAKSLSSSPLVRKVSWSTFQDEARKPVLHVYPATEIAELPGFYVTIIPTASSLFNVSRMNLSTRSNVRAYTKDGINLPTPKYNSSILEDMFLEENAEFISSTFADWKSLQEALVLLKVRSSSSAKFSQSVIEA